MNQPTALLNVFSDFHDAAAGGEPDFSGWIAAGVPGVCRYVSLSSDARAGMAGVNDCQTDFGESVPGWIPFEWS